MFYMHQDEGKQWSFIAFYGADWCLEWVLVQSVDILLNRPPHLDLIDNVTRFSRGQTAEKTQPLNSLSAGKFTVSGQRCSLTSGSLRPVHMVHLETEQTFLWFEEQSYNLATRQRCRLTKWMDGVRRKARKRDSTATISTTVRASERTGTLIWRERAGRESPI